MKKIVLFQNAAQRALESFLNAKYPESKQCFFKNIRKLQILAGAFYLEVVQNCGNFKSTQEAYLACMLNLFGNMSFDYNSEYLDAVFKEYHEQLVNFPKIGNPELHQRLSIDLSSLWNPEASDQEIQGILANKKLQRECLLLAFHLKIQKIRKFLEQPESLKKKELTTPKTPVTLTDSLTLKREAQRQLMQHLEKPLNYLDNTPTGLKDPQVLKLELMHLNSETARLNDACIDELDNNLLLLPIDKSITHLKQLKKQVERKLDAFHKYEYALLNTREDIYVEPELQLQLRDREDIVEVLTELNGERTEIVRHLQFKILDRLEDYEGIKKEFKSDRTIPRVVKMLEEIGFFNCELLVDQPNTALGELLAYLTGMNEKNLTTAIGEITRSGKKPKSHYDNQDWVQKFLTAVFGRHLSRPKMLNAEI